jgi:hypothetical protein
MLDDRIVHHPPADPPFLKGEDTGNDALSLCAKSDFRLGVPARSESQRRADWDHRRVAAVDSVDEQPLTRSSHR